MKAISSLTAMALAGFATAQSIDSLDPCGQTCYTNALNMAGSFACAAMDMACLCPNADWGNAIRDCAQNACPPGYAPTVTNAASALCATATLPPGAPIPTSSTPPTTEPTPSSTEEPTTSTESTSTSTHKSSTRSKTTTTSTTSTTSSATTAAATTSVPTTSSKSPTKVATASTSATTSSAAATSAAASDEDQQSGGMTEAAKIGVSIGISAAVVALLAVAVCIFLRKKRERLAPTQMDRFKISHPIPNDDNAYTRDNNSDYDIGSGGDLEMKSRRYEDMLPREEPRQMEPRQMV